VSSLLSDSFSNRYLTIKEVAENSWKELCLSLPDSFANKYLTIVEVAGDN
jgi:hypothetical protein